MLAASLEALICSMESLDDFIMIGVPPTSCVIDLLLVTITGQLGLTVSDIVHLTHTK